MNLGLVSMLPLSFKLPDDYRCCNTSVTRERGMSEQRLLNAKDYFDNITTPAHASFKNGEVTFFLTF